MSDHTVHKPLHIPPPANVFQSEDQLIVALDFGTTFSGIAYASANGDKPEVISIMEWPGLEGYQQPKVPTLISYDESGDFAWGGQKHKSGAVRGVKLLLDPDQPRPIYLPESTAGSDIKALPKAPLNVAANFIRSTYEHAMAKIESAIPTEYLDMCQKQFVLTVPAAAKEAGLHPVTLIKEPEAAAMYTLHNLQERALTVGDAFVICDAGCGTVDLISYEITALKPSLTLKELVPGKGGMAGSLGLNKRFEDAVKNLVGEDQFFHLHKTRGFELAVQQFVQSIKTAFRNDSEDDYLINFPMADLKDDPQNKLKANCWNITNDDVKAIFDPLIADILRLVDDQVNLVNVKRLSEGHTKADEVKAIFLVGGFGSSEYLKCRLEEEHPDIQVIQPHGAWGAIVKGAVLSRLPEETSIESSQATRHYGVAALSIFDPNKDEGQAKIYDNSRGIHRVNKMTWYIHRGEDLKREQSIKFPFYRTLEEGFIDDDLIFKDELLQSEKKAAPTYPSASGTKTNCFLTADLRKVDRSNFKKVAGFDGKNYVEVHCDLVITMQTAIMKFSLVVSGQEMGSVTAKYD